MSQNGTPQGGEPLVSEQAIKHAIEEWRRFSGTSGQGKAWTDYILLLNHYAEALQRAPQTPEMNKAVDMIELINAEFSYLSRVLAFIFPHGAMGEKSYEEK